MANILIADDEAIMRTVLRKELALVGHNVTDVANGVEAIELLKQHHFDLVITDMKMPGKSGTEVLKAVRAISSETIVILITAYATIDSAVEIMKLGADDYIVKPFNTVIFVETIQQLLNAKTALAGFSRKKKSSAVNFIGTTPVMLKLKQIVQKISNLNTTVLITGESGTGKGVIAKEIHRLSVRNNEPFVHLDCSSLNPNLIESELFGSEKGAFTSSYKTQVGKIELAGHGTLFLDEIGNLPFELQSKLLLVIEERFYYRVGGTNRLSLNARIIAATNANLEQKVAAGQFREDLYYRLNVINIEMPPLRYHKEDIETLVSEFISKSEIAEQKGISSADETFLTAVQNYNWPGNIRELENAVESALALCEGSMLTAEDLPVRIVCGKNQLAPSVNYSSVTSSFGESETNSELESIRAALDKFDGHREKTAAYLGISRRTLQYKLKKYNLL